MLDEHLGYVTDRHRLEAFRSALSAVIKPGDRVLDLGCGCGILGLLALEAGAGMVYSVDETMMADVARQAFRRAGFEAKSIVIRDNSARISLPEPMDVVVCDNVGYFGMDYFLLETLADARRRFLRPGGVMVPMRLTLKVAIVESPDLHEKSSGWSREVVPPALNWLNEYSLNTRLPAEFSRSSLVSEPQTLATIELGSDDEFVSWQVEVAAKRDGFVHGLAGWFEAELAPGVTMTNAPEDPRRICRPQAFFPISNPCRVEKGEHVKVTIRARPADQLIAWAVEFPARNVRCTHSTWNGRPVSRENLHRLRSERVPSLSSVGRARSIVLGYCDGKRTAAQIESAVLENHPLLFPSSREISRFVAHVLSRETE